MRILSVLVLLISFSTTFVAQSLDAYKYVIVPNRYEFLGSDDQYELNSLTKFLFEKEGFVTLFEDEKLPEELVKNPCLGLKSNVLEESGLFTTKLAIRLTNCRNEVAFLTPQGKSKEKDFKKSFHEALRGAFEAIRSLNYNYQAVPEAPTVPEPKKPATPEIVDEEEEVEEVPFVVLDENSEPAANVKQVTTKESIQTLYAQPHSLGFQLVDSTPKIVYVLLRTDADDEYILKDKNGILKKEAGKWIALYYLDGQLVKEELSIKF